MTILYARQVSPHLSHRTKRTANGVLEKRMAALLVDVGFLGSESVCQYGQ